MQNYKLNIAHAHNVHVVQQKKQCGKMASKKVSVRRLCNSTVASIHSISLFSVDSQNKNLPVRLSTLLQLPVSPDDDPSHCCRPCMRSFLATEKFFATVKLAYESRRVVHPNKSPVGLIRSRLNSSRKRVKNTSGPEVSPCTFQSQPSPKRSNSRLPGKRLAFTTCKNNSR